MSLTVLIAPLAGALALQSASLADRSVFETYSRPAVAPYQTPSDFGRETAQGDGDFTPYRDAPLTPVTIDAYRHSYEYSPSDREIAYEQGVAQAEFDADIRAGALDGRWRLIDEAGRLLAYLSLSEPSNASAAGAWMEAASGWAGQRRSGAVSLLRRDERAATMDLVGEGRLILARAADGAWVGMLADAEGARPVVLKRRA
jgi:hypothetical protein